MCLVARMSTVKTSQGRKKMYKVERVEENEALFWDCRPKTYWQSSKREIRPLEKSKGLCCFASKEEARKYFQFLTGPHQNVPKSCLVINEYLAPKGYQYCKAYFPTNTWGFGFGLDKLQPYKAQKLVPIS